MAFKKGQVAWNKGLTKKTTESIRKQGEEHSKRMKHLIKEGKLKTYFMINKTGESPIKKDCPVCKIIFTTFKSQNHNFCSQECYWKYQKGKHNSPSTEFKKGHIISEEQIENQKKIMKGNNYAKCQTPWNKNKKGLTKHTKEWKDNHSKYMIENPNSGQFKKGRRLSEESERKRFENQHMRPTRPEKILDSLLQQNFPNEYKYTGDGKTVINGRNPDFLNCNGQKKAILLNGVYWHLTRLQKNNPNMTREEVEIKEGKPYDEFGFKLLHI